MEISFAGITASSETTLTAMKICSAGACITGIWTSGLALAAVALLVIGGISLFTASVCGIRRFKSPARLISRTKDIVSAVLGFLLIAAGFACGYTAFGAAVFTTPIPSGLGITRTTPGMHASAAAVAFAGLGAILTVFLRCQKQVDANVAASSSVRNQSKRQ